MRYGLDYTLVVQGIDQLRAIYDRDAGTILNNCAYKWYCNVTDMEGARHLSESLGEATVRTTGKSQSSSTTGEHRSSSESTTWGEKGRRLLTPDEIINLGRDVAIAFQPEGLPIYLKPVDYWNLHRDFAHIETMPDWRRLFWEPPLAWDANPYVAGSSAKGWQNGAGNAGQSQGGPRPPKQPQRMSADEARAVLGLGPDATRKEIEAAYKRLMGKVHPDHEGSTWMAQKLNEAKDVLLGK